MKGVTDEELTVNEESDVDEDDDDGEEEQPVENNVSGVSAAVEEAIAAQGAIDDPSEADTILLPGSPETEELDAARLLEMQIIVETTPKKIKPAGVDPNPEKSPNRGAQKETPPSKKKKGLHELAQELMEKQRATMEKVNAAKDKIERSLSQSTGFDPKPQQEELPDIPREDRSVRKEIPTNVVQPQVTSVYITNQFQYMKFVFPE